MCKREREREGEREREKNIKKRERERERRERERERKKERKKKKEKGMEGDRVQGPNMGFARIFQKIPPLIRRRPNFMFQMQDFERYK